MPRRSQSANHVGLRAEQMIEVESPIFEGHAENSWVGHGIYYSNSYRRREVILGPQYGNS